MRESMLLCESLYISLFSYYSSGSRIPQRSTTPCSRFRETPNDAPLMCPFIKIGGTVAITGFQLPPVSRIEKGKGSRSSTHIYSGFAAFADGPLGLISGPSFAPAQIHPHPPPFLAAPPTAALPPHPSGHLPPHRHLLHPHYRSRCHPHHCSSPPSLAPW